ncbi:MAG: hypothetical protein EGQ34_02460 [Sutterella sp.]|nr:hypothetical protein [Sutterella sp.]
MKTDPGRLKTPITLLEWRSEQDGTELAEKLMPIATIWGQVTPVKSLTYWFGQAQLETGVTHQVTVRRIVGKTRPEDLTERSMLRADGQLFQVLRAVDLEGAKRFTVFDCVLRTHEEAGDG